MVYNFFSISLTRNLKRQHILNDFIIGVNNFKCIFLLTNIYKKHCKTHV